MPRLIPCRTDLNHYSLSVALDGVTYGLEFRWNVREGSWYMFISDELGAPVLGGVKVVCRAPLAGRSVNPARPPGYFVAQDTDGSGASPGVDELGGRVRLLYFSPAEL